VVLRWVTMSQLAVTCACLVFLVGSATAQAPVPDAATMDPAVENEGPEGLKTEPPPLRLVPPPPPVVPPELLAQISDLERSGKRMRAGGAVMLALGIALEITGQVLVLHSQLSTTQTCATKAGVTSCSTDYNVAELGTGIGLGVAGAALLYTGPTVMSAGSGRIRRARFLKATLRPEVSARQLGLRMTLTF